GVGTNTSNSADSSASCEGSLSGGYYVSGQNVEPIDLLGNRYLNLHECQVSNGRDSVTYNVTTPNWIGVGTNASNSADTTPACENNLPGNYVIQGQTVQALDIVRDHYFTLHACQASNGSNACT